MQARTGRRRGAAKASLVVAVPMLLFARGSGALGAGRAGRGDSCRRAVIEGEVHHGAPYTKRLGNGLELFLQPIASGWILRVLPVSGPRGAHDYAELATPPYNSVTPLSLSTDFSFRAQDAVGWNPRRFRFATDAGSYNRLAETFRRLGMPGEASSPAAQGALAEQVSQTATGRLIILDARIVPGTADQWSGAGAVASHFQSTAHTLEETADGKPSALGELVSVRFRIELDLPSGFRVEPAVRVEGRPCVLQP